MDNNKVQPKNLILFFVLLVYSAAGYTQPRQLPSPYLVTNPVNYVRTWDAVMPETVPNNITSSSTPDKFKMTTQYIDGLGRPLQTVMKQGSLDTKNSINADMISPVLYDEFGREQFKYLPFASTATDVTKADGSFKLNPFQQQATFYGDNINGPVKNQAETYYYAQMQFESSPLNRVTKSMPPGNSWVGANSGTDQKYWFNTLTDAVRIWNVINSGTVGTFGTYASSSYYAAGLLYKKATIDEHGKEIIEFKDKEGKVILKKVQLSAAADNGTGSSHNGWLCTYYLYDDLNNLRCVIQPRGVELISGSWILTDATILAEQCFRYEYDGRNRMIIKKVPGAGDIYMVYDLRDRLVATSTAAGRSGTYTGYCYWMFTLYDAIDRPVATGEMHSCLSLTGMISYVNGLNNGNVSFTTQPGPAISLTAWNPVVGNSICTVCSNWYLNTITHYDDYTGLPAEASVLNGATIDNSYAAFINTSYNTSPDYAQPLTIAASSRGMVTWTTSRTLGTSTFLYTVQLYDNKGRALQSKSTNITAGIDIATTQYNWSGQPLITVLKQQKAGSSAQTSVIITKLTYDNLARLVQTDKKIQNTNVNGNAVPATYTTISKNEYDALGQLKSKKLAPAYNSNAGLETLAYDYNIRGWLLGENRDYVKDINTTSYFGFDLGYDKNGSLGTYIPQYNGNISGTIWKGKGDNQKRKYDFTYDAVNRLTAAGFNQYVSGSGTSAVFNISAGVDFSVSNITYDANGNIVTINQNGLKINSSSTIDQFNYTYQTNSNKLKNVRDALNDPTSMLGDFKTSTLHPQYSAKASATTQAARDAITDYNYDANGNLTLDNNKSINSISYNYLNLPQVITITGKGTITYTYDAAGNKLKKVTSDITTGGKTIVTTITYIAGSVYESKQTTPANTPNDDYTDVLQFTSQEEGRIRRKTDGTLAYDYFLKDHLGNVRMVLTDELSTKYYPAATLEGTYDATTNSMVNIEKLFYKIDNTKIFPESSIPSWVSPAETVANTKLYYNNNGNPPPNLSYPTGCTPAQTAGSNNVYKLNATSNKTGLEFMIKVMAGDRVDIFGKSYYLNATTVSNANSTALDLLSLMTNMLLSPTNAAASKGVTASQLNSINTGTFPSTFFRGNNGETGTTVPKAYINYVFLDDQFKYAGGGASRVGTSGSVKDHWYADAILQNITAPKNGYIFVFVSNESNFDVFFDNLQVVHKPGPILEETHYYPFGLTMSGISSKAVGEVENKKKYNGYEFSSDFDINLYESFYRSHDPQIGRFWQLDPKPNEEMSLYSALSNNPVLYSDPLGDTSMYYNSKGKPIGVINRGSGVTAIEVGDGWANLVGMGINAINGNKDLSDREVGAYDALLQSTGTAYNVSSFEKFYNDNQVDAKSFGGDNTKDMKNFKYDGKPMKLKAEVYGDVVLEKGVVTMGTGKTSTGSANIGFFDDIPRAKNSVADIHTHPISTTGQFSYDLKSGLGAFSRSGTMIAGPSGADMGHAQYNHGTYRSVVVDAKNVYLYQGAGTPVIVIPRK